jgi:hypothetical protein
MGALIGTAQWTPGGCGRPSGIFGIIRGSYILLINLLQ